MRGGRGSWSAAGRGGYRAATGAALSHPSDASNLAWSIRPRLVGGAVRRRWCETTIGVSRHRRSTDRHPPATPPTRPYTHAVCVPPDALQGSRALDEAAGVRDLYRAHQGEDAAGRARIRRDRVALRRPCEQRLPEAAKRARLRAHAVRDLAGERVPHRGHEPSAARPPRPPPSSTSTSAARKLRLARAASAGGRRLRGGPPPARPGRLDPHDLCHLPGPSASRRTLERWAAQRRWLTGRPPP
jgi:hypothetical protein